MFSHRLHQGRAFALLALVVIALLAARPALAQKIWDGGGDGITWSQGTNWVGDTAPIATDLVVLDNSTVPGSFSVMLPGGAVTTSIVRLTIMPSAGQTITLTLPGTNVADPGFRVGDAVAGTDDIILKNGAILRNLSGASSGNGIQAFNTTNGIVRIENGGRYVHKTFRLTAGIVPLLSTDPGTEFGEFEYDTPGTGSVVISASGRTYGSLTLTRSAGPATYTSMGSSPLTVRGNFTVNTGVTYTSGMSAPMHLGGNLMAPQDSTEIALSSGQPLFFDGTSGPQTIYGNGRLRLNGGGTVAAAAAVTLLNGSTIELAGTLVNNGSFTVSGTLEQENGGLDTSDFGHSTMWTVTGVLSYNTSAQRSIDASDLAFPAVGGPVTVEVHGGGITMNVARSTGTLKVFGPVANAGNLTVTGAVEMNAGGSFSSSPIYGPVATLSYFDILGDWIVGPEWAGGQSVGPGVPRNVTIDAGAGHTVSLPASDRYVPGTLTLTSGTLAINAAGGDVHVGDVLDRWFGELLIPTGRWLVLDGLIGPDQDISMIFSGDRGTESIRNLRLLNAHVTLTAGGLVGGLAVESARVDTTEINVLALQGDAELFLDGNTLRFQGLPSPTINVSGGTRTIHGPGTVEVNDPLTVTGNAPGDRMVDDTLNGILRAPIPPGGWSLVTFNGGSLTLEGSGSIAPGAPPTYANGATLVYGSGNHTVGGEWTSGIAEGPGVPGTVTIQAGAGNTVTMPANDWYLSGDLNLMSGILSQGADFHVLDDGVDGIVIKNWADGFSWAPNNHWVVLEGAEAVGHFVVDLLGALRLDHLRLDNAQVSINGSSTLELSPAGGGESLRMLGNSSIDLGGNTLRFAGAASTVAVADGVRTIHGPGFIEFDAPLTVSTDEIGFNGWWIDTVLCTADRFAIDFGPALTTISGGDFVLQPGGLVINNHPPSYTNGATLVYATGGLVTRGAEWSARSGPGFPVNVTVASGTTLNLDCFGCDQPDEIPELAGNLTVNAGAAFTANEPGDESHSPLIIDGNLTANGPITMSSVPGADWFVLGNVTIDTTFTQNGRALVLAGSADGFYEHDKGPSNLKIAKTGSGLTTLNSDMRISGSLDLAGGDIVTGSHRVVIAPGATVNRTSGAIRGNLQKHLGVPQAPAIVGGAPDAVQSGPTLTFEVGDAGGYTPVDITYASLASAADLTVSTTGGEHPDVASSGINPARDVNRYWTLSLDRAPDPSESFTATFHYLPGDVDPTADYNHFEVFNKSGNWVHYATVHAPDRQTASGLTRYGDYAIGTPFVSGVEPPDPAETYLRAPAPNPFRVSTVIAYGLKEPGRVRFLIFDVKGHLVRRLMDGIQEAGPHSAAWDGRDDTGQAVASGIYLARMETAGDRHVASLRLVR